VDDTIVDWFISILSDYKQQGPVARISFLLAIGGGCAAAVALLRRWRRSGFERLEGEIEELKRRLESASNRATRLETEKQHLEHQLATLLARDPWCLVSRAEDERKEGNEEFTLRLLRQAVESSGPILAQAAL
jgi:hypothetical protein